MKTTQIQLEQSRPGFRHFIGAWLIEAEQTILIDVGPRNTIDLLVKALQEKEVKRVDYVLLTHIHIDHAGGVARFLEHYPMARVVCHEKGVPHLLAPGKLAASSRSVLGDLVEMYGPIGPVPSGSVIAHRKARIEGLDIVETPGHAAHHLCFLCDGHLFAGEAAGVFQEVGGRPYTRPATPPVFHLEKLLASIEKLLSRDDCILCYAHYGKVESSHRFLSRTRTQLLLWRDIIQDFAARGTPLDRGACLDRILEEDPYLEDFKNMSPEDREREREFMTTCVEGYEGYLGLDTARDP